MQLFNIEARTQWSGEGVVAGTLLLASAQITTGSPKKGGPDRRMPAQLAAYAETNPGPEQRAICIITEEDREASFTGNQYLLEHLGGLVTFGRWAQRPSHFTAVMRAYAQDNPHFIAGEMRDGRLDLGGTAVKYLYNDAHNMLEPFHGQQVKLELRGGMFTLDTLA